MTCVIVTYPSLSILKRQSVFIIQRTPKAVFEYTHTLRGGLHTTQGAVLRRMVAWRACGTGGCDDDRV